MPNVESLPKAYDPKLVETETNEFWEQGGYFHPEPDDRDGSQRYCIVIPPPNALDSIVE